MSGRHVGSALAPWLAAGIIRAMARIVFTPQLRRFLVVPDLHTDCPTLRAALDQVLAEQPRLAAYLLDEQRHLRANVVVFIDGRRCNDRIVMDDPLTPDSTVHVLQALSGG